MEFITVDYIDQVKERIMPFLLFVAIPCLFWWLSVIKGLIKGINFAFFTIVDDEPAESLPKQKDDYDGDYLG